MASTLFLKLTGIPGDSLSARHKDEIDVLEWNWRVDNAAGAGAHGTGAHGTGPRDHGTHGSGGRAGRAHPGDLVVRHRYDRASPLLAKACVQGGNLAEATLTLEGPGEGRKAFLTVTLSDVTVTSVQVDVSADGDVVESFSLGYERIQVSYVPTDVRGAPAQAVTVDWNVLTGTAT
jgi:type VI secretion system secreted protein Hcp